ncbi:MAG: hypothetical protein ABJA82_08145 [Myxococcales bacterium]
MLTSVPRGRLSLLALLVLVASLGTGCGGSGAKPFGDGTPGTGGKGTGGAAGSGHLGSGGAGVDGSGGIDQSGTGGQGGTGDEETGGGSGGQIAGSGGGGGANAGGSGGRVTGSGGRAGNGGGGHAGAMGTGGRGGSGGGGGGATGGMAGHVGAGGTGTGTGGGTGGTRDGGTADGGVRGYCDQDKDCVFRANDGCCGSCLAVDDTPVQQFCPGILCVRPPGGCSCKNHMCERGALMQGDTCQLQQDSCGNGLKCCRLCGTPDCMAAPRCTQTSSLGNGCPLVPLSQ